MDTGLNDAWAARYITAKVGRNIIGSFNHGSMACALPMSIGAQLLYPERQVIALCGDGGMTMLMGELLTLVQYNLPIKVIVYNNGALGFINLEMRTAGYPEFQTDMKNPDFARMAEVIGMKGFRIEKGADVEPVIKAALATPGPVLVDALTDPAAIPPAAHHHRRRSQRTCPRPRQARPHGPFQRHDGYDQIEYQAILGEDSGRDLSGERSPPPNALPLSLPRLSTLSNPCSDLSLWRRGERLSILMSYIFTIHRCNLPFREHKNPQLNCPTKKSQSISLINRLFSFHTTGDFLRAASPLYKSLRWRAGFGEGGGIPSSEGFPLPPQFRILSIPNYGSMKLKGPAWR